MSFSDGVNLGLAICTGLSLIASIVIIVITLRQNHHMIENATRPYVTLYSTVVSFDAAIVYLVLRNFGQSNALITGFSVNVDLSKAIFTERLPVPFEHIVGLTLSPNQAIQFPINHFELYKVNKCPTFQITYSFGKKTYSETVTISFPAQMDCLHLHASPQKPPEQIISNALQELVIRQL